MFGDWPEKRCISVRIIAHLSTLFIMLVGPTAPVLSESIGDQITKPYKPSTVRVSAAGNGFGFIVGERNGYLSIVTAEHVIQEHPNPRSPVNVYFYEDKPTQVSAEVISRKGEPLDIAVLRVAKPRTFKWTPNQICTRYKRADMVWWVGRDRDWDVT